MLDKATVLTTIFTITDDAMKASSVIQSALRRPGRAPKLSDSEVVTLAIYQELIGEPREDHFFRLHAPCLRWEYFRGLNERSRYNRRKRDLWSIILAVRMSLQIVLDALLLERTGVVDSAPVPVVGYKRPKDDSDFLGRADYGICSSKAMKYFGAKLHTLVSLTGVIMNFVVTAANRYDNQPVTELLDNIHHHLEAVLGDKAYNDAALQDFLWLYRDLTLLAPTKANQQPQRSPAAQRQHNILRLIVERINSQLQEQFHLSKHYAKSMWGFVTRIAAKLTAHSMGMMVNQIHGKPPLRLAALAV
jgi:hypothetical protein